MVLILGSYTHYLLISNSGTARDGEYFEQAFIVSGSIDRKLKSTIYTRISEKSILMWIQEVTGNIMKNRPV